MDNLGFKTRKLDKEEKPLERKKKGSLFIKFIMFSFIFLVILGVVSFILIKRTSKNIDEKLQEVKDSDLGKNWQTISEDMEKEIKEQDEILEEERGRETDVLSDGKIAMVLNLVTRKEEIGGERAKDGYEFVILDLSIRNQEYEDIKFYSSNFILRDKRYTEYRTVNLEEEGLNLINGMQDIKARESLEGSIVYEVRKEIGMLEFVYMGEKKLVFEIE